jgi:hypothetical protein
VVLGVNRFVWTEIIFLRHIWIKFKIDTNWIVGIPCNWLRWNHLSCIGWSLGWKVLFWMQVTFDCYIWIRFKIITDWKSSIRWNEFDWNHFSSIGWMTWLNLFIKNSRINFFAELDPWQNCWENECGQHERIHRIRHRHIVTMVGWQKNELIQCCCWGLSQNILLAQNLHWYSIRPISLLWMITGPRHEITPSVPVRLLVWFLSFIQPFIHSSHSIPD